MLVGKNISSCSYPKSIKITNKNINGTLFLAVKRGDEITVEYSKKEIINKINSYFGYRLIDKIRLQAINSESKIAKNKNIMGKFKKNFGKKINEIKSENIRNSLSQLFNIIKND
jgi:hypothetical protein